MKRSISIIGALVLLTCANAQDDYWDVYVAQYEKGPGSVLINMSLKGSAPNRNLPFIVAAGVKFRNCDEKGFPLSSGFETLYKASDSTAAIINSMTTNIHAGTFTYQCERSDYFYVADTSGLREKIIGMITKYFDGYVPVITIRIDKDWSAYLDFLYPNEETMEYMSNEKVLLALQKAGDKLEIERQVDHWVYFKSDADRNCFIQYATQNKFKIESKDKEDKLQLPYKLRISRTDKVDVVSITNLTLELKKEAKKCHGEYDGWETFVVK